MVDLYETYQVKRSALDNLQLSASRRVQHAGANLMTFGVKLYTYVRSGPDNNGRSKPFEVVSYKCLIDVSSMCSWMKSSMKTEVEKRSTQSLRRKIGKT